MRLVRGGVILAWLAVGCAASPDGEVEVEGLVIEAEEPVEADWRDPASGRVVPATSGLPPQRAADLGDGFAVTGLSWSVDGDEWVEASSRVLDRDEPSVAADVIPDDGSGTTAPADMAREAACEVTLEAPVDRGLRADGELAVVLVVVGTDGGEESVEAERWVVDVGLEAGERATARTERLATVERSGLSQVRCEVALVEA